MVTERSLFQYSSLQSINYRYSVSGKFEQLTSRTIFFYQFCPSVRVPISILSALLSNSRGSIRGLLLVVPIREQPKHTFYAGATISNVRE